MDRLGHGLEARRPILIGYAILVGNRLLDLNPHKPTLDWRAASWLLPYLVGMGLIVYFSDFGPKGDDALIAFGWDMLVVAAWSSGHLLLGDAGGLSKETIEEMIGEVGPPEEGMEASH